jgi:hypothetical protein
VVRLPCVFQQDIETHEWVIGRSLLVLAARRRRVRPISHQIPRVLIVVTVKTQQLPVAAVMRIVFDAGIGFGLAGASDNINFKLSLVAQPQRQEVTETRCRGHTHNDNQTLESLQLEFPQYSRGVQLLAGCQGHEGNPSDTPIRRPMR